MRHSKPVRLETAPTGGESVYLLLEFTTKKENPMKVTDVERIVVDVPFTPRQHKLTRNSISSVYNWSVLELCKVTTDTGHVGWGETVIRYTYGRVTDQTVDRVMGQRPAELMNDDSLGAGLQMALFDGRR